MKFNPLIALVDDHPAVLEALDDLLQAAGASVVLFASAEAFLASDLDLVALVICDIEMPGMSGLELQRRLGQRMCKIPLIFISASPKPSVRADVLQSGALVYLQKPFDGEELLRWVSLALTKYKGRDALSP